MKNVLVCIANPAQMASRPERLTFFQGKVKVEKTCQVLPMTDEQLAQEFFKGMMFERWVRFQFLEEREGEARIAIPADWLSHIALAEPELSALANALNGLPADLKNSQKGLAAFFSSTLAKAGRDAADINRILRNQLIWQANDQASDWLMMHEQTLPRLEFAKWLALFGEWQKNQPKS